MDQGLDVVVSRQDGRPTPRVPSWSGLPAVTTHTEVHVGPFNRLRDVLTFVDRISSVSGVRDVRIERWVARNAVLVVRHHHNMPLLVALRELEDGSMTVSIRQPHGIRIELGPKAGS